MENVSSQRFEDLEKYDAAHAPAGLMIRYVRGRLRTIWLRFAVAGMGCLFLAAVISANFGLMVAAITLSLESLECWMLKRWVPDRIGHVRATSTRVALASALQSIGIGLSIFLTGIQSTELRMVAWSFLLGAVLNSMLAAHFHPASNVARMWVLCLSALFVLLDGLGSGHIEPAQFWTELVALGAMGIMIWNLFIHLMRRDARMQTAERELIQRSVEAERLALVAKHASDSIILMDPDMTIQWVNPQFTNVSGYTAEQAIGRKPSEFLNHADTSKDAIDRLIHAANTQQSINLRVLNQTRDGRAIWVETHQTPVIGDDGKVNAFIAVERDATALVAREKQLQHALMGAKEADREKAAFLSRMSHELRTPANGILGGLDILRETTLDDAQTEALGILDISGARLKALLDNLVTTAALKSDSIETQFADMRIDQVIDTIVIQHQNTADQKVLNLRVNIDPTAKCVLRSDPEVVHGVLEKLVDNAIKFTRKGHVQIEARLEADNWLHLIVTDTGVGIPKNKLSHIFEPFEQADDHDTRNFDGAGLGLTSAQNLAGLLGGRIRVRSVVGQGTQFKVKIPVQVVAPVQNGDVRNVEDNTAQSAVNKVTAAQLTDPKVNLEPVEKMRLLVAEDNRANRMLIKSMLKGAGHAIDFAEDGVQAVAQYIENRPDFVLMDLSMPNKNGFDATREIRALEEKDRLRRCPIVAVTANVTEGDRRKCFDVGMDAFLPKPVKKAKLLETITKVSA